MMDDKKLKDILVKESYVSDADALAAEQYAKKHHVPLLTYLLDQNILTKDLVGQAIAEFYKTPYADLNSNLPTRERVLKIPEEIARKHRVVLFEEKKGGAVVATDDPSQEKLASILKKSISGKITFAYGLSEDIDAAFSHYRKTLDTRFGAILKEQKRVAPEIIDAIFDDALSFRASDIHFEPQPKDVVIRFRVDGALQEAGRIQKEYYENILNRIKVQSHLRIDEHFAAQDGSLHFEKEGHMVDMRTSIVPTVDGEKIVLRVLAAYVQGLALSDLGLLPHDQKELEDAANKPFGMILVTGPTGSGKTTTLYALLHLLNDPADNIMTIEDPVEYKIVGVNQIQVNPQTNLTFSQGLRSIVRQDPDTILLGEIRDPETAEIAVNAALTGHLLLSTFHANDAATAIPRLLDMGIEPFLLTSTLEIVLAQRLARRICEQCRHSVSSSSDDVKRRMNGAAAAYFGEKKLTLYEGKGCAACNNTGYKGRIAVFEFIRMTPAMRDLVLQHPSSQDIWRLARREGSRSLFEDGVDKVKNGVTTFEELMRIAEPPQISV